MKCKELFDEINRLNEKYIKVWEEFCNIESPTSYKEGVDKSGAYVAKWAKDMGFEVDYAPMEKSGDVICITMNPNEKREPVCISGHIDTVHPAGLFGSPAVHLDEEKIYGPGVVDCKGGIVAGMLSMEALKNVGFDVRPVKLILQSDEEVSSRLSDKKTIDYMCKKSKGAVAFLNLEGFKSGCAVIQRKGIVTFEFKVKGIKAHAASCAVEGANAIAEAAYKIIELEKLKDDSGITCNCGLISGGVAQNTVPDECVFRANIRFADASQYEWVTEYVTKIARETHIYGCVCEVATVSVRPAMERCEKNLNLLLDINRIYSQNGIPLLNPASSKGGSDAAYVTVWGIPCVDSLGIEGGNIHSENEFAYIKSLEEAARRIASVIYCI